VAKAWARQLQREGGAEFVNSFSFRVAGEGGGVEVLVVHVPTGRTLDLTEGRGRLRPRSGWDDPVSVLALNPGAPYPPGYQPPEAQAPQGLDSPAPLGMFRMPEGSCMIELSEENRAQIRRWKEALVTIYGVNFRDRFAYEIMPDHAGGVRMRVTYGPAPHYTEVTLAEPYPGQGTYDVAGVLLQRPERP
jgi:hypothetical protein